jgi:hypothetical protein
MAALTGEPLYNNRCGEILSALKSEPTGMSDKELAEYFGLSYRAVQAATARMEWENPIGGRVNRWGCSARLSGVWLSRFFVADYRS